MKILRIVLLSIMFIGFVLFGIVFYIWKTDTSPCIPDIPKRIGEVPNTAEWIGGCDGGNWFNITEIKPNSNKYKVGIYYDYNGKLIVEKYFYIESTCVKKYLSKEDLFSVILYYDFFEIHTKNVNCHLMPVDNKNE